MRLPREWYVSSLTVLVVVVVVAAPSVGVVVVSVVVFDEHEASEKAVALARSKRAFFMGKRGIKKNGGVGCAAFNEVASGEVTPR